MRYIPTIFLIFLISTPGTARFSILSVDREKVEIRFTTDARPGQTPPQCSSRQHMFLASGADGHVLDSAGRVLPSFSFRIAVPGTGDPEISVLSLEKDTFALESFPTVTTLASRGDTPVVSAPAGWLGTPKYETIRDVRTAVYTLSPVSVDNETGRITIVRSVSFRISYPRPTTKKSVHSLLDRSMLEATVLNSESLFPHDTNQITDYTSHSLSKKTLLDFSVGTRTPSEGSHVHTSHLVRLPIDRMLGEHGEELSADAISLYAAPQFAFDSGQKPDSSAPEGFSSVPLIVDDLNQDGFVDHEDRVLAYVQASSGWWWDSTEGSFQFRENPNTDTRPYVLVLGSDTKPLQMAICPQPSAADTEITSFPAIRRYREFSTTPKTENRIVLSTLDPEVSTTIACPHAVYDRPEASFRLIAYSKNASGLNVFPIRNTGSPEPLLPYCWADISMELRSPAAVRLGATFPDSTGAIRIDAVELRYNQHLDMEGLTELEIFPPNGRGVFAYTVRNLPEEPCYVLRVPKDDTGVCLLDLVPPMISTYSWYDSAGKGVRYHVIAESAIDTVDSVME